MSLAAVTIQVSGIYMINKCAMVTRRYRAYRFNPVMIKTSVNHNQGNCIKRNVRTVQGGRGLEQQLDP